MDLPRRKGRIGKTNYRIPMYIICGNKDLDVFISIEDMVAGLLKVKISTNHYQVVRKESILNSLADEILDFICVILSWHSHSQ